ncbi:MAG: SPFH domain-containing protein [Phycisphaerales bacterium JB054]
MKADHLSFKRASSVSMLGLAIQIAISLVLFFYGYYSGDRAAFSASFLSMVGVLVWLVLLLLFDQHRRERLEAMEAEALAEEANSSVFEEGAADLRLASRRLQTWYRFVIPVVSILIGAALIALGYWRYRVSEEFATAGALPEARHAGWAMAFGLIIAFVGFVFARFVSGMAKQAVWANLRGGSAYAVAAALVGLLLAVSQFVDVAGSDALRRLLVVGIPILMIGMGIEVLLNFLLDLYRPRKKGVYPRPAFDSRVLSLISAPDRIARSIGEALDYQLGFGVQQTWFYRLVLRSWPLAVIFGIFVVWLLSCWTVVGPDQRGMVLRFGAVVREDIGPGIHFKAPWPIDRVVIPELTERTESGQIRVIGRTATGIRTLQLGTPPAEESDEPILWTNEHTKEEIYNIVQPSISEGRGARGTTQDVALVAIEVPVKYAIADPLLFDQLGPPGVRESILRVEGMRAVTVYLSAVSIDQILGADRSDLAEAMRQRVQAAFDGLNPGPDGVPRGSGVKVLSITAARMHPPSEVAPKFEEVVIAEQNRQSMIETALGSEVELLAGVAGSVEAAREIVAAIDILDDMRTAGADEQEQAEQEAIVVDLIADAQGEAAIALAGAQAQRWNKHMGAWSEAIRYEGMVESYKASPMVYQARMYFDTLQQSIAGSRIFIVGSGVADLHIRGELQTEKVGIDLFTKDPNE